METVERVPALVFEQRDPDRYRGSAEKDDVGKINQPGATE